MDFQWVPQDRTHNGRKSCTAEWMTLPSFCNLWLEDFHEPVGARFLHLKGEDPSPTRHRQLAGLARSMVLQNPLPWADRCGKSPPSLLRSAKKHNRRFA